METQKSVMRKSRQKRKHPKYVRNPDVKTRGFCGFVIQMWFFFPPMMYSSWKRCRNKMLFSWEITSEVKNRPCAVNGQWNKSRKKRRRGKISTARENQNGKIITRPTYDRWNPARGGGLKSVLYTCTVLKIAHRVVRCKFNTGIVRSFRNSLPCHARHLIQIYEQTKKMGGECELSCNRLLKWIKTLVGLKDSLNCSYEKPPKSFKEKKTALTK